MGVHTLLSFLLVVNLCYVVSQTDTTLDPCVNIICTTPYCTENQLVIPWGCCTSCEDIVTTTSTENPCSMVTCPPISCTPDQEEVFNPELCCPYCQDTETEADFTSTFEVPSTTTIVQTTTTPLFFDPCMNMTCALPICDDNQVPVTGGPDNCCLVCQDCRQFCEENDLCPFSDEKKCRWSQKKEKTGICGCCHKCVSNHGKNLKRNKYDAWLLYNEDN